MIPQKFQRAEYRRLIQSKEWRVVRKAYYNSHPLCERCEKEGIITPATEVHHIQPLEQINDKETREKLAYDEGNLMSVCRDCHIQLHKELNSYDINKKKEREKNRINNYINSILNE